MKIGFMGLGLMGSRMAKNLIDAGYKLSVYNRTKEKANSLLNYGAEWEESPANLAEKSDILITMLADPAAVEQSASGEKGFLNSLKENSIWIDCSTVNPSFSKAMAEKASEKGVRFIDAPVAGSILPAEKGELIFLIGGEKKDIEESEVILQTMGKKLVHAGGNGMGTSMKMIFNLLLGSAMAAFSEALTLGESMGIEKASLLDALIGSAVVPPFLTGKKDKLKNENFVPEFPLRLMQKDLHLASVSAYEYNASLPVVNSVKELFEMAKNSGMGDEDFSAVYKFLKEVNQAD